MGVQETNATLLLSPCVTLKIKHTHRKTNNIKVKQLKGKCLMFIQIFWWNGVEKRRMKTIEKKWKYDKYYNEKNRDERKMWKLSILPNNKY